MFDGLGLEINTIIDNLCSKFGVTAEELIPELCKYKVYESIGYLVAVSMVFVFTVICFIIVRCASKKYTEYSDVCFVLNCILMFILFLLVIVIASQIYNIIIWKNAPIWSAVNYVIEELKHK